MFLYIMNKIVLYYRLIAGVTYMAIQLTVVPLVIHNVDLWRATLPQQRVQRCSTAVTNTWFQRGG